MGWEMGGGLGHVVPWPAVARGRHGRRLAFRPGRGGDKPLKTEENRGKLRGPADSAKTGKFCPYTPYEGCGARRPWSIMAAMEFVNLPGTHSNAGLLGYPGR